MGYYLSLKKPVPIYSPEHFTKSTDYSLYKGAVTENPPISNNAIAPKTNTTATNTVNKIDNKIPASNTATTTAATATAASYPGQTINRRTVAGSGTKSIGVTGGTTTAKYPAPAAEGTETKGLPIEINPADGAKSAGTIAGNIAPTTPITQTAIPNSIGETIGDLSPGALLAITAAMFAPQNLEKIQATTEDAICNSSTGGCLNTNLKQPLQADILGLSNLFGQAFDLSALGRIDAKLGDQLPGGISGFLKKAWASTTLDKALNLMNTALLLHNAAHLSRNIGQTVGDVIGNALATIGIKDAEGNAIDFNQTMGSSVTNLIKAIIGTENYNQLSVSWAKANRIYQTGMNMLYSVRNLADATTAVAEIAAENIGVVGNALKRAGTVRENAFPDLPENVNGQSRLIRFLDQAEEVADTFENITSNTREVREELAEINQDRKALTEQLGEEVNKSEKTDRENKNLAIATPEPQLGDEVEGTDE